jgi:hypothetical protein
MVNKYLVGVAAVGVAVAYMKVSAWRKNFKMAQMAGFPTFYSPHVAHDFCACPN